MGVPQDIDTAIDRDHGDAETDDEVGPVLPGPQHQRAADDKRTFGYRRFEILAAAFNALMLFAVAIYVLVEAVDRFRDPEPVQSTGMLVVAAIGLAVNLVSMRLLTAGKDASLNVKGAYLEVWADMLGSLGVIAGAGIIMITGWLWVDPLVAIGIGLWVLPRLRDRRLLH